MYVYNRSRLMGLDYILNIYCYSESHASCEANHQVKQNNKCQASGVGEWRVVLKVSVNESFSTLLDFFLLFLA